MSIFENGTKMESVDEWLKRYREQSALNHLSCEFEYWEIQKTNSEISYLSHDFFRYFGKFPPPVAERFINNLHEKDKGPVVDPTTGSGTTLVEAIISNDNAVGMDINPLSCLVSKVKTTYLEKEKVLEVLKGYRNFFNSCDKKEEYIPDDRYIDHWFYEEVQNELAITRCYIEEEIGDQDIKDLFSVGLASIVRDVSLASNGLGRMFKDNSIPVKRVRPKLEGKIKKMSKVCENLYDSKSSIEVKNHDARKKFPIEGKTDLVICHPPYFNLYRYSSIYKFETLWAGLDYNGSIEGEIREGFKKGDKELLGGYLKDMTKIVNNSLECLSKNGYLVLMVGDTIIKDERVNTTSKLIDKIKKDIKTNISLEKIIVRKPKYTEASYSATQRRKKEDVGVSLADHILIIRKS